MDSSLVSGLTAPGSMETARLRADEMRLQALGANRPANMEKMEAVSQEFEAVFLTQMMQHMFEGIQTDDMFGGGQAEEIYRSFMLDEYGKLMSRSGGVGVAEHIKKELIALQEAL